MSINHRERIETVLSGKKPDRVPVALWRHFPVDDMHPENLAAAVVNFQRIYDFDLVKVTPVSTYFAREWGVQDEWRGNTEGTRDYTHFPIQKPEDWTQLQVLDPTRGGLSGELECLKMIVGELGPDVPVIQTIFSPLGQAKKMAGDEVYVHMRRYPDALEAGLKTIAESTQRFVEAILKTGIAGIFYAVQQAQYGLLSRMEFKVFGRAFDLEVLQPAEDAWLKLLHIHGNEIMFDDILDYPVSVINWHDQETPPSLTEGKARFSGTVCGGLRQWESLAYGTPDQVKDEARKAIQATEGERFILGTGCVTPIIAPHGNIMAARQIVEE